MKKTLDEYIAIVREVAQLDYKERNLPEEEKHLSKECLIRHGYSEQGVGIALFKMRRNEEYLAEFIKCRNADEAKKPAAVEPEKRPKQEPKQDPAVTFKKISRMIHISGGMGEYRFDGENVSYRKGHTAAIAFTVESAKKFIEEFSEALRVFEDERM